MTEAIRAEKLVKTFGKITALAGVSLEVAWGETLGILGDNGAGKSTLIKILTGYHQPDSGQVFVDGKPVELTSVDEARAFGIECVYQDLALVNGLSIYHNMFLNRELLRRGPFRLLDHREMRRRKARILLLDEPLAAMGAREARLIIGLIERLRARGDIAIVMIAHNYAQTLEICDRVVLMQHGEITFESAAAATSAEELLEIVRREYRAVRTG
ncbi:MAG: sugar ABC transporter ATP-binding protein [Alphaproteobacteria bacterium]|nr:MAG: sugar ABC transporter ATP-binding protein [Alphaproteobacteria bacterium]